MAFINEAFEFRSTSSWCAATHHAIIIPTWAYRQAYCWKYKFLSSKSKFILEMIVLFDEFRS